MNIDALTAVGLTHPQAEAYAAVIERGEIKPPELAALLSITRSNAYKLLDKLVEYGLVKKVDTGKISYVANNPTALSALTSQFRAEAVAREEAARNVIHELLEKYHANTEQPDVQVYTGSVQVAEAYRSQLNLREEIFFIHTRADLLHMDHSVMHDIRTVPSQNNLERHAIMTKPKHDGGVINYAAHKRSNLNDIVWVADEDYTAPVEWSVTESSLLIVSYGNEPHAVLIANPVIASAFLQLWSLLHDTLKQRPAHVTTPTA